MNTFHIFFRWNAAAIAFAAALFCPVVVGQTSPSSAPDPSPLPSTITPNVDLDLRLRDAAGFVRALQANRTAAIPSWVLTHAKGILIFTPGPRGDNQGVGMLRGADGYGVPVFYRTPDGGRRTRGGAGTELAVPGGRSGAPVIAVLMSDRSLMVLGSGRQIPNAREDLRVVANVHAAAPETRHGQLDIIIYQPSSEIDMGIALAVLNAMPDNDANSRYYHSGKPITPVEIFTRPNTLSPPAERLIAAVNLSTAATASVAERDSEAFQRPRDYFQAPDAYYQAPSEYFRKPSEYFQTD